MERKVVLGLDFILLLSVVKPDKKGNTVSGTLYYKDSVVKESKKILYETAVKAIENYKKVIVPDYIIKNNIKNYSYLKDSYMIKKFVRNYLTNNVVTYGTVLDIIDILNTEGYTTPTEGDVCNLEDIISYFKTIDKISLEFKKQLCAFGYGADRNPNNTYDHDMGVKHPRCKNLVYTRYPWTPGYKADKSVRNIIKRTAFNYVGNQDMEVFSKNNSELYYTMNDLLDTVHALGITTQNTIDAMGYSNISEKFYQLVGADKNLLISKWRKLTASRYGQFVD